MDHNPDKYERADKDIYGQTHTHTYTYTYTHAHAHAHTFTQTPARACACTPACPAAHICVCLTTCN